MYVYIEVYKLKNLRKGEEEINLGCMFEDTCI